VKKRGGFGSVLLGLGAALAFIVGSVSVEGQHLWNLLRVAL
jgi:hypothetical protein